MDETHDRVPETSDVRSTPEELADRLWGAVQARTAIRPLTEDVPDLTVDAAYDIQDLVVDRHLASGALITAAKLGLTSVAKQRQMHVSEPLYGWMTDRMALARRQHAGGRTPHPASSRARDRIQDESRPRRPRRRLQPPCSPPPSGWRPPSMCSTPGSRATSSRSPTSPQTTPRLRHTHSATLWHPTAICGSPDACS